jgi:hypothetical protein
MAAILFPRLSTAIGGEALNISKSIILEVSYLNAKFYKILVYLLIYL